MRKSLKQAVTKSACSVLGFEQRTIRIRTRLIYITKQICATKCLLFVVGTACSFHDHFMTDGWRFGVRIRTRNRTLRFVVEASNSSRNETQTLDIIAIAHQRCPYLFVELIFFSSFLQSQSLGAIEDFCHLVSESLVENIIFWHTFLQMG